jgi:hypothetical protein
MDHHAFDRLARTIARPETSRRRFLAGLFTGALGIGTFREGADAAICRDAGSTCREDANCCEGRCLTDATKRRRCVCPAGTKNCRGTCIPVGDCCSHADCRAVDRCTPAACIDGTCNAESRCQGDEECGTDGTCAVTCVAEGEFCSSPDGSNQGTCCSNLTCFMNGRGVQACVPKCAGFGEPCSKGTVCCEFPGDTEFCDGHGIFCPV